MSWARARKSDGRKICYFLIICVKLKNKFFIELLLFINEAYMNFDQLETTISSLDDKTISELEESINDLIKNIKEEKNKRRCQQVEKKNTKTF